MFMFLNYKKINLRTISKIFCFSLGFFFVSTFAVVLTAQASCVPGPACPTGQIRSPGPCAEPDQINCITDPFAADEEATPATDKYGLEEAGSGLSKTPLSGRVSTMIGALVGFVGVIFLVLMIYGGLTWMTAGGNEEKVGKAKKVIVNSTIGLVIVMLSYAITYYIIQTVSRV